MKFSDLETLSGIPDDTIRAYMTIMLTRDESSNTVAIITATKADAMRQLNELAESFLSGRVNIKEMTLEAPNGTIIRFIPMTEVMPKIRGRRFKAIHFR